MVLWWTEAWFGLIFSGVVCTAPFPRDSNLFRFSLNEVYKKLPFTLKYLYSIVGKTSNEVVRSTNEASSFSSTLQWFFASAPKICAESFRYLTSVASVLVLELFLKSRNSELRFLLPVHEMRNCESKNAFHDSSVSNSGSNSSKMCQNGQGTGINDSLGIGIVSALVRLSFWKERRGIFLSYWNIECALFLTLFFVSSMPHSFSRQTWPSRNSTGYITIQDPGYKFKKCFVK